MTLPKKIILNKNEIASYNEQELLVTLLDIRLNFDSEITSLCKIAGQKPSPLARINHHFTPEKKILLLSSVVKPQFNYFPQIWWMFTSRYLNNALTAFMKEPYV